jgi:hypothetical protein
MREMSVLPARRVVYRENYYILSGLKIFKKSRKVKSFHSVFIGEPIRLHTITLPVSPEQHATVKKTLP